MKIQSKVFRLGKLQFRINWLIVLAVVFSVAGLSRLGFWQLDRAAQRREIEEREQVHELGSPNSLAQLIVDSPGSSFAEMDGRIVSLDGTYLNDKTFFVVYQQFNEQLGYEVITPFRLRQIDALVLVSRGWISPADYENKSSLPRVDGRQSLVGRIHVSEQDSTPFNDLKAIEWPLTIRYVNVIELGGFLGRPVFPHVVRLAENQPGVLIRHWQTSLPDWTTNISYAMQWFTMAFAVVVGSLLMSSNIISLLRDKLDRL